MGEDQNKSDEERFEEGLRQILDGTPSGGMVTAGKPPKPPASPEVGARGSAYKPPPEPKALFWFKLMRPLAMLALLALFAKFVLRITSER
ncbi:MAG: hypothetical protein LBC59_04545 [Chitinispirillales bacterium]|jgi:hypothetical protein|nr:hypothetical protein [Chitinispirillales bacterium]